jgi:hypothetical protein
MLVEQRKWTDGAWSQVSDQRLNDSANLVLVFGSTGLLGRADLHQEIQQHYPQAHVLLCSTAGEIVGNEVLDDTLVSTAIKFDRTKLAFARVSIDAAANSAEAGRKLAAQLDPDGLRHVMVFSDGLKVNGTALVGGLGEGLPANVCVTGGLVGDGTAFTKTLVGLDGPAAPDTIVAVGFYGDALKVGFGSMGGWDTFGPQRLVTRSDGNVLYELDGQPALTLYKKYLGDKASGLPGTGLLFPLSLQVAGGTEVVRTLLAVDEKEQSMTFAGDIPQGAKVKLMSANFERLIDGAANAAGACHTRLGESRPDLAILISCVGRKLVLGQRTEEEVEAVQSVLGDQASLTGFYSYGEICPTVEAENQCLLHNQTMTITTFSEN